MNGNQSNNNQNERSTGVRQRAVPLQANTRDNNNNNNNNSSATPTNASRDTLSTLIPPPPISSGVPRIASSKIFDALAHPAQAAAAAAHANNQAPRGRKRKTASLILLTVICGAVVYYSGTMYDYDDYFVDAEKPRKTLLRNNNNRSPTMAVSTLTRNIMHPQEQGPQLSTTKTNGDRQKTIRNRIVNAIKAAFVADAASMGTHWIYNTKELEDVLQSKDQPEFRSPPVPRFYSAEEFPGHYTEGMLSPYGEQLLFVTQYAASRVTSPQQPSSHKDSMFQDYDDDDDDQQHPYSIMEPMSAAFQKWATNFGGRADHAALQFLSCRRKRVQDGEVFQQHQQPPQQQNDDDGDSGEDELESSCGADDDQAHFFLKVIPMTCLYLGHAHRRHYVEQAIRVHQNNDNAVLLGLALSDLLEKVLLMEEDDNNQSHNQKATLNNDENNPEILHPTVARRQASSLREALDDTLLNLKEDHGDGWFHFADAWTAHHQQQETLLDSWLKAQKTAEKKKSIAQVAAASGTSCHMPGALIVSLHALYRAANAESKTSMTTAQKKPSAATTHRMGYDYLVKTLLGIKIPPSKLSRGEENPLFVAAIRGNILAAGDTSSRAIFIGAVLGAAYGGPPTAWYSKVYPVVTGQVEEAAYTIANYAVEHLNERRR